MRRNKYHANYGPPQGYNPCCAYGRPPTVESSDKPIMLAIKKTIRKWLDNTPSFNSHYAGSFLVVTDSIYSTLAAIEFRDDRLVIVGGVNTNTGRWWTAPSIGGVMIYKSKTSEIYYSDPDLHTRLKRAVNRAYEQFDGQPNT